jgi:hypothetical protein
VKGENYMFPRKAKYLSPKATKLSQVDFMKGRKEVRITCSWVHPQQVEMAVMWLFIQIFVHEKGRPKYF